MVVAMWLQMFVYDLICSMGHHVRQGRRTSFSIYLIFNLCRTLFIARGITHSKVAVSDFCVPIFNTKEWVRLYAKCDTLY